MKSKRTVLLEYEDRDIVMSVCGLNIARLSYTAHGYRVTTSPILGLRAWYNIETCDADKEIGILMRKAVEVFHDNFIKPFV